MLSNEEKMVALPGQIEKKLSKVGRGGKKRGKQSNNFFEITQITLGLINGDPRSKERTYD